MAGPRGQYVPIVRCLDMRTHPLYAGFIEPEEVAVPQSAFGGRDRVSGRSVLGEQLESGIAGAGEASGGIDAFLLAVAVGDGAFVDVAAFHPVAAHHLHPQTGGHRVVLQYYNIIHYYFGMNY